MEGTEATETGLLFGFLTCVIHEGRVVSSFGGGTGFLLVAELQLAVVFAGELGTDTPLFPRGTSNTATGASPTPVLTARTGTSLSTTSV